MSLLSTRLREERRWANHKPGTLTIHLFADTTRLDRNLAVLLDAIRDWDARRPSSIDYRGRAG